MIFGFIGFRYHLDDEIKTKMGELEQDNLASFDANDNEVSIVVPSLKVTSDVRMKFHRMNCQLLVHFLTNKKKLDEKKKYFLSSS